MWKTYGLAILGLFAPFSSHAYMGSHDCRLSTLNSLIAKGDIAGIRADIERLPKKRSRIQAIWGRDDRRSYINTWDGCDVLPLENAATRGNPDLVDFLLKAGADPNLGSRTPEGKPGRSIIQRCLGTNLKYPEGRLAGQIASLKLLIAAGANPNHQDRDGRTALHDCLNPAYTAVLIQAGASPNIREKRQTGNVEDNLTVFELAFLTLGKKIQSSNHDDLNESWTRFTMMLGAGADVISTAPIPRLARYCPIYADSSSSQPSTETTSTPCEKIVRELINAGADINAYNNKHPPALWNAARVGNIELALWLLTNGANPNVRWNGQDILDAYDQNRNFGEEGATRLRDAAKVHGYAGRKQ